MLKMLCIREFLLVACFFIATTSTKEEVCENIDCECFLDEGGIEYHCPSYDWHRKLIIQKFDEELKWDCKNIDDMAKYIPNLKLKAKSMRIKGCNLTVDAATNIDFEQLETIRIFHSNITSEFVEVLRKYTSHKIQKMILKYVHFNEDAIIGNFSGSELRVVDMSGVDIKFGSEIFKRQSELDTLSLLSNHIKLLKEDAFEDLIRLKYLDLSDNDLVYLHSNTFKNLASLLRLYMTKNNIEELDKHIFKDMFSLLVLDMSNNSLCLFHKNILKPLVSLREFYLDNNRIDMELDDYLFSDFPELRKISVRSSKVKKIPENIFSNSPNIQFIDFAENSISQIPSSSFDGLTNLQILIIEDNEIKSLEASTFKSLSSLTTLDMSGNKLQHLDSKLLAPLVRLRFLDAHSNKINYIGQRCFDNKEDLREIDLSFNQYRYKLESKERSPFAFGLKKLVTLDLSTNLIEEIPQELLERTSKLRTLDLQGNKIKSLKITPIWKAAYKSMLINLEGNEISKIIFNKNDLPVEPEDEDEEIASYVFLAENPIDCDCSAKEFLDFINKVLGRSPEWGMIFVMKDLQCASPKNMKGIEFLHISKYITGCH